MMLEDERRKQDTEYIATVLWSLGRMVGGSDYDLPSYDDYIHPKPKDERTSQDIVSGLINKLEKGVTIENGNDGIVSSSG